MPKSPTPVQNAQTTNNNKDLGISVPDSQTLSSDTKNSKKYTVYKVAVETNGRKWFVLRRYNEFHTLYDKVKKVYPEQLHNFKLPGKKLFGNNFDPDFIKMRREGLDEFVRKILGLPNIFTHADVRMFFQLDNPRNSSINTDEEEEDDVAGLATDLENVDLGQSESKKSKPSDFQFLKVIGKGSFGKVLLAKHKVEEKFYAIKVLHKAAIRKRNEARHIMAERNVLLKNVKHPFLVGLHYSFQTSDKLYFVLDYVNGGELFFHLQRERYFPEHRARFYAAEIGSAIGYLHKLGIIYRDLKPENILLDSKDVLIKLCGLLHFEGHVVLTDFGLCKEGIEPKGTTSTFCGTPEYLAPEVLRKQSYDKSVDWWCLGAVTYEMMYGLPPFYSRDTSEMYDNILHKPLRLRTNISQSARHLLEQLLQKEKSKRLGSSEADFEEIKTHPFFRSINFEELYDKKIEPTYNPNVSGQLDLKHFDPEFVREPVPESVKKAGNQIVSASVDDADDAFAGFTYVPPSDDLHE